MAENPYDFGDDLDADLWHKGGGPRSGEHTSFTDHAEAAAFHLATDDGDECPNCGKVHVIPKGIQALPRQLHGLTAQLLAGFEHGNIATISGQKVPSSLTLMSAMVSYARHTSDTGVNLPIVRAMAEVLDEMTDGKITTKLKLYHSERNVRMAHTVLKTINGFVEQLRADEEIISRIDDANFVEVASHMRAYHIAIKDKACAQYRSTCVEIGVDEDAELLETGRYTKGSPASVSYKQYFRDFFTDFDGG